MLTKVRSFAIPIAFCAFALLGRAQRIITTVVGTDIVPVASGSIATSVPVTVAAVAADSAGNVYIVDEFQHLALKVDVNHKIMILAGNGFQGYSGDGGPAVQASLNTPNGVAVDAAGNVYIGDSINHRVRKIDTQGIITTIAGTGQPGFSGDGGPGVNAQIQHPSQLMVDAKGNVYFADLGNHRIRKVDTSGVITTVAGNGKATFSGDNGPAVSASLDLPESVAMDPQGRLVIADTFNYRIRRVDTNGIITTIAGTGAATFGGDNGPATQAGLTPASVAVDAAGNIYIADASSDRIRRVDTAGVIATIAGTGNLGYIGENVPAISSPINYPSSIFVDASGALLLADQFGNRILRISQGLLSTVAGNGHQVATGDGAPATAAVLNRPDGLAIDANGVMYVADTFNEQIRRVDLNGRISTIAGNGSVGYGGDGGPALQAPLGEPMEVAVDAAGNVYIADNQSNRIRKVTPSGTITTYVGNGLAGFSGDGVQATQTALTHPSAVVFDAAGNLLIADTDNNRIRRVSPQGIITTFAGNGQAGFSGDGGNAQNAALKGPMDVSLDPAGNVLIADTGNQRVRRVNLQGIITTVAGNGTQGFSGDGGPALSAAFNLPLSVAADSAGNLFIADRGNYRIRQVNSAGVVTTFAGDGVSRFQGDGGLATAASVSLPSRVVVDSSNNVYIADTTANRIRKVLAAPPPLQISTTSLSFNANSNGASTDPQRVFLSSPLAGLQYFTNVTTQSGGAWLRLSADAASLPTNLVLRADPTGLSPGTYQGQVAIQSAVGSSGGVSIVQVTFDVAAAALPQLSLNTLVANFGLVQTSSPATRQINVNNVGSGSLPFTAAASTGAGGNWLSITPSSGTASPNTPATLTLTVSPAGLDPGTYPGTVTVTGGGTTQTISVAMTVSAAQAKPLLSQSSLNFRTVQAGGKPLPQGFGILNVGVGQMSWTATASTLSGGGWLSIDSASGSVATPFTDVSIVSVSVDPAGLTAGDYYGKVVIQTPGNTSQTVMVLLNVLPSGTILDPEVRPSGLIFTGVTGSSPGSQSVAISNRGTKDITYTSSRLTFDGAPWFLHAPAGGTVTAGTPLQMTVQPDLSALTPGTYQGAISILFDSGAVQTVQVLAVIASPAGSNGAAGKGSSGKGESGDSVRATGGCTPSSLNVVPTDTQSAATAFLGQPLGIGVKVTDNCSNPLTNTAGSVVVTFSDGSPIVNMAAQQKGQWSATWQPSKLGSVQATVTAFEGVGIKLLSGQITLTVQVINGSSVPSATASQVTNSASFAAGLPVAPGSLISIFGNDLSLGPGVAFQTIPLPTQLNGVTVTLGDRNLPLFYASPSQLNAQVPFDLPVNTQHQLLAQRGNALSVPATISVAPSQPAIFAQNQQGFGQGSIVNAITNVLADSAHPVKAGDVIAIYCTGLGVVSPPVAPGDLAPQSTLSFTTNPVTATVGGQPATVMFSGLAPGLAGLYQVNAVIPDGVPPGPAVPVQLQIANQTSPPVTIAVSN